MPFVPFSPRAQKWELIAVALRRLAEVRDGENVDPYALAEKVGLHLVDARFVLTDFPNCERDYLLITAKDRWSGGVLPWRLPNGKLICILNPTHDPRRNRITLLEEIVHIHRNHIPSKLRDLAPGLQVRDYNKEQEVEAYGIGAAVLLPWRSFYSALDSGETPEVIAAHYDVTVQLIRYRIKITGATNLYRNRSQSSGKDRSVRR